MTAIMLLTANTMHRPDHGYYSSDSHIIDVGMKTVDLIADGSGNDTIKAFRATLVELRHDAWRRHKAATVMVDGPKFRTKLINGEMGLGTVADYHD